jgi:serine/threonine protein phosphatase 1
MSSRAHVTYAIGDVHGASSVLRGLLQELLADAKAKEAEPRFVFLGDLVNKGPDSAGAVDIVARTLDTFSGSVLILGNHDYHFRRFLRNELDKEEMDLWIGSGMVATLASYGVAPPRVIDTRYLEIARTQVAERYPHHIELFEAAILHRVEGGYCFVHAGLRPGVALKDQKLSDLISIRGDFLETDFDFGFVVVHGHTPTKTDLPEVHKNRIALDTKAWQSGRLTALTIPQTGQPELISALRRIDGLMVIERPNLNTVEIKDPRAARII